MTTFMNIANIEVADRQRRFIDKGAQRELADSIATHGLLHPIVVHRTGDKSRGRLVAGERRLRAVQLLYSEGRTIPSHSTIPIPKDTIPITPLEDLSLLELMEMEFDENVQRAQLDWQDQCQALATIDAERKKVNPASTHLDLAGEIRDKTPGANKPSLNAFHTKVNRQIRVAEALALRPDLQKAKSSDEAYRILLNESAERFESALARRKLSRVSRSERLWDVRRGDLSELLIEMPDSEVDFILTDPPYGIDINTQKFAAGTTHRYDDSETYARDLCTFIIQEGWRLTKPRANLFIFCKWSLFGFLKETAKKFGWDTWADPIIWQKSHTEGSAPWGRQGFIHTFEMALFATKGQKGVYGPIPDVLDFQKVPSRLRQHGAEKPTLLLEYLIEKMSAPGELILDPCVGSGSTLLAAAKKSRRSIGVEVDEKYYNRAMTRMHEFEQERREASQKEKVNVS